MALKTNSKQVKAAIMEYIRGYKEDIACNYEIPETELENDDSLCFVIYNIFRQEALDHNLQYKAGKISEATAFHDWASGLAMYGMFDYYYYPIAVNLAGSILQETESEKSRFTESDAEKLLTNLIYREIVNHKNRVSF
jgi:hypothetical protein